MTVLNVLIRCQKRSILIILLVFNDKVTLQLVSEAVNSLPIDWFWYKYILQYCHEIYLKFNIIRFDLSQIVYHVGKYQLLARHHGFPPHVQFDAFVCLRYQFRKL